MKQLFAILALSSVVILTVSAQAPQQKAAQKAMQQAARNKQALTQFTWKQSTQVEYDGEVRGTTLEQISFDASGRPKRTRLSPEPESARGLRGRKQRQVQETVQAIMQTAQHYLAPSEMAMRKLMGSADLLRGVSDGQPIVRVEAQGFVHARDSVKATLDGGSLQIAKIEASTFYKDAPMSIDVSYKKLKDGTNVMSRAVVAVPSEDIRVSLEAFEHVKVSGSSQALIPAGKRISVRLIDPVDSDQHAAGQRFRASLAEPVIVNGTVAVPMQADASLELMRVKQSGTISGSEMVELRLVGLLVNGRYVEVVTGPAQIAADSRGAQSAKRIGGLAAAGALVGAIAGGGKGALIGASAGAGAGTVIQMGSGQSVKLPPETLLSFTLTQNAPLH